MNPNHVSRFITDSDQKELDIVYRIPSVWWSRHYEYVWAGEFVESKDAVLDVACGICHPFKMYLAQKAESVFACDNDPRITSRDEILKDIEHSIGSEAMGSFDHALIDKISFSLCDIGELPYEDKSFDKVFCISVFEHLENGLQLRSLHEFARVLKDDGLIVMTVDYPDVDIVQLMEFMKFVGLKFYGDCDFSVPSNAIRSEYWGRELKCVRLVLCKE